MVDRACSRKSPASSARPSALSLVKVWIKEQIAAQEQIETSAAPLCPRVPCATEARRDNRSILGALRPPVESWVVELAMRYPHRRVGPVV